MSKKKLILTLGVASAALVAFGTIFTHVVGRGFGAGEQLHIAMELLDEGRWDLAGRIARELEEGERVDEQADAAWHYVQGVSKLQSVQKNLDTPANRRVLLDATQHLEQAKKIGFPLGYQGKGEYYLGCCYFHTYQWDAVTDLLKETDKLWPQRRSEAFAMLVEAELRKQPPNFEAAKAALATWKAIPGKASQEQARYDLAHVHLAFLQRQPEVCQQLLLQIPTGIPEYYHAQLWRGRCGLESWGKDTPTPESLQQAAEIIRGIVLASETPPEVRRQATYFSGRILRAQGNAADAMSTFSGTRQSSPHSSEAIASGVEEAEILMELDNTDDAVATLHHILRNTEDLTLYNEAWLPRSQFRARVLEIGRQLRQRGEYERALRLAKHIGLAFPAADSVRLQAEALEEWADYLATLPKGNTAQTQQQHRRQVTAKHLAAAELYENLALIELRSNEYPSILWSSIANYQRASQLGKANELLVNYLRFEDRTKRPRGFLALGRNYMNSAQWEKALEPLERCLFEHPVHPISFEARLLASKAHYELQQMDEAIELLSENLYGNDLSLRPGSEIWRNSLYQLGQTIFRQGDRFILESRLKSDPQAAAEQQTKLDESHTLFLEAIDRLGEFVSRYPEDERNNDARYLIAKSLRLAAETPEQIAASSEVVMEKTRRNLIKHRRSLLEKSLEEFRNLHQTINRQQESLTATEANAALLRNCYFGEADTLYDLGRWEEAIQAYQNVASRFLNQPESLEALLQMAECYRQLGQDSKVAKMLVQAEQVLNRIPPELDSQFVSLTRTTRQGWNDLIGSMRSWN